MHTRVVATRTASGRNDSRLSISPCARPSVSPRIDNSGKPNGEGQTTSTSEAGAQAEAASEETLAAEAVVDERDKIIVSLHTDVAELKVCPSPARWTVSTS